MEVIDSISENKERGEGHCGTCPLRKDILAWFECADARPQVVVVSESPVSRTEHLGNIEAWRRDILTQCSDKTNAGFVSFRDPSAARYMGEFLGGLTKGRIYNEADETKTHGLYWTHTVKCFLQNEENKEMPFRTRNGRIGIREMRKSEFKSAIRECSMYLPAEIQATDPKLVIAVGTSVAGRKLMELKKSGEIRPSLCEVYHPGARKSKSEKQEKIRALYTRVRALGLTDVIPASE